VQKAKGDVQQFRDDRDGALASYEAALTLYRQVGDRLGEANVQKAKGDVQQFRDDRDGALASYEAALTLYRQVGARLGEANVQKAKGDVQQFRDDRDGALASYEAALTLYRQVGDRLGEANVLAAWSRLLIDSDFAQSQALLEQALVLRQAINDVFNEGADNFNYGVALLNCGRNQAALPYLERARELFASRGIEQYAHAADQLIARAQGASTGPNINEILRQFDPLLQAIAAVARGERDERAEIEALLQQMEANGWRLSAAAQALWAGERDAAALTAGINANSARLVIRMLELVVG
jgi:tetratricopeptide (TPR) repeat protein